jgi:hypothetical protein
MNEVRFCKYLPAAFSREFASFIVDTASLFPMRDYRRTGMNLQEKNMGCSGRTTFLLSSTE